MELALANSCNNLLLLQDLLVTLMLRLLTKLIDFIIIQIILNSIGQQAYLKKT